MPFIQFLRISPFVFYRRKSGIYHSIINL